MSGFSFDRIFADFFPGVATVLMPSGVVLGWTARDNLAWVVVGGVMAFAGLVAALVGATLQERVASALEDRLEATERRLHELRAEVFGTRTEPRSSIAEAQWRELQPQRRSRLTAMERPRRVTNSRPIRCFKPYADAMPIDREFDVALEAADEGGFIVSVPDLPGCWTQGETRDEALTNAKEAIGAYLDALEELGRPLPKPRREHVTISA